MTILIDADGCPVVDLTLQIAKQFDVPVILILWVIKKFRTVQDRHVFSGLQRSKVPKRPTYNKNETGDPPFGKPVSFSVGGYLRY